MKEKNLKKIIKLNLYKYILLRLINDYFKVKNIRFYGMNKTKFKELLQQGHF